MEHPRQTHAKNRYYRRIANRQGTLGSSMQSTNPNWGKPIPGELTATEIAHKARRRLHRKLKLADEAKSLPLLIQDSHRTVSAMELRLKNQGEDEELSPKQIKAIIDGTKKRIETMNGRLAQLHIQQAKFS